MEMETANVNETESQVLLDSISRRWRDFRDNKQFIDATIVCSDGGSFSVHRVILSAYSRFFKAMFTNPMRIDEGNKFELRNVRSSELEVLLSYVYDRQLDINLDNVFHLLHAADYLSFLDVHKACVEFLKNTLNHNNCLSIRTFARNHFIDDLEKDAQMFLHKNFPQVAESSQEILSLPLDELVPILDSDLLNVRNENIVWKLVIRWVDHDKDSRIPHLVALLKCIRLGLMDVQYFLEEVKNHPYILGNEACRPVVIDTLKVLMDVETITQQNGVVLTPECARPRIPHEVLFAIGGWSGGSPTNAVETYDTRADRWIQILEADPTGPRAYHGTAVIGTDIYVIGGFDGMENFNSCRCFNAVTKTWREIAPMHERRCYVSVVVLGDMLYAMGGYNGHHRQNTVEKYDYRTNQWTVVAPMTVQRSDASATVFNGKIYITGGFDGRECLNTAEVYDPATNMWAILPPMRSRRSGVSCIAYRGCIYVLGGFNGVSRMNSVEKFNPSTNQWHAVPDMYTNRSNFAIEVIDDMIFAIGGFNGMTTIHQVECYDETTNSWYEATDMNVFRSALSACVISNLPNINDYIHQNRDMLMEEKRQRLLALSQNDSNNNNNDNTAAISTNNSAIANISQAIQEVNNAVGMAEEDVEAPAVETEDVPMN
ncbi:kelch-like protein 10 isoform X2 [Macrosteles quadrilineatus]|uniref:kelch-like protein 10 isoform X2 n=1 Tax=Macrosteles quadrilineatus TaxID=74068 RepID=UPI0023E2DABF|nr:kelch-like protein 10 isoform X2 [Macrosteles quadrilineatus]